MRPTLLFALFFSFLTQAQTTKWEYGFSIYSNLSQDYSVNDGTVPEYVQHGYDSIEISSISFSGQGFIEYKLGKKSTIGMGLGIQKTGLQTRKMKFIFGGTPVDTDPIAGRFVYKYYHAEVPIFYKFQICKRFYVLCGASALLNISNRITSVTYFENKKAERSTENDHQTNYRFFNVTGIFGFGYDYLDRERFTLYVQPYAQYHFLGISKSAPLNRNMFSFGLVTGIRLKTKSKS